MAVVTGKCKWAKLLTPSEATKDFKSKYELSLYVDTATKTKLFGEGLKAKIDKESKEEYFVFWTSGYKKDGTKNSPVRLIDMQKNPITEEPGNGSVILVQYSPTDYTAPGGAKGVFAALQGVQVKKLISRTPDEFEAEDDLNEFEDDIPF